MVKYILSLVLTGILLFVYNACENNSVSAVENWGVGVSTVILDDFSQTALDELANNNIQYVELDSKVIANKTDEEIEKWVKDLKQKTTQSKIEIWSIHLPFSKTLDISSTNKKDRNHVIERHKKIIALLEPLEIQKFVIHPSACPIEDEERSDRLENSIASLKTLTKVIEQYDTKLALEVMPRTCLGNTSDEILEIVNTVGNGLEICFDSNHLLQEPPEEFIAKVGDLITTVHISDYDNIDEKHWLPKTGGVINWNNVITELINIEYKGPWMYEVSRGGGRGRDESYTPKDLADNWQQLKIDYAKVNNK